MKCPYPEQAIYHECQDSNCPYYKHRGEQMRCPKCRYPGGMISPNGTFVQCLNCRNNYNIEPKEPHMTPQEMVIVIEAFADGKQIEAKSKKNGVWGAALSPAWNFFKYDYRIKPEPQVIYVVSGVNHTVYQNEAAAIERCKNNPCSLLKRFVEDVNYSAE